MSVTTTAGAFARRMSKAAAAVPVATAAGTAAAGEAMKAAIVATAAARGTHPQDGWVQVKARGADRVVVGLYGNRAYWAERGTRAHDITPKRGTAILTPAGPRARARVSGVRARPFFLEGAAAGRPAAVAAAEKATTAGLRRGFA